MNYIGEIYRPPSEAHSLLLQVTVGCSHNRCDFCGMYRKKSFQIKPIEIIMQDIEEAATYGKNFSKVFLCDGDALILHFHKLEQILELIQKKLPWVRAVNCYGDARGILSKTSQELKTLKELGLNMVYQVLESGSQEVLKSINKGFTVQEAIDASIRLKEANIRHSVMFLLGLGGTSMSLLHAQESAKLLSLVNPEFAAALSLTLVPDTPLFERKQKGEFTLPSKMELLQELLIIIQENEVTRTFFSANHASNYLPLSGWLPQEKEKLIHTLRHVIELKDESLLKPEWQRGL